MTYFKFDDIIINIKKRTKINYNWREFIMMDIRTVIWDCDNVMWFYIPQETEIIAKALNIANIEEFNAEFFNMVEGFNVYFAKKRVTLEETYKIIEKEMPILYFSGKSSKDFMEIWDDVKFKIKVLNKDVLKVMEYLKAKGIRQVVKTDWWKRTQIVLLREYGILKYIEKLHCCDNEYLKCNPLSAKEIIKRGKEEGYVIIGDSLMSDIAFAHHAKIKSIWFNRDKKPNNTIYTPSFEIVSLLEIMEII